MIRRARKKFLTYLVALIVAIQVAAARAIPSLRSKRLSSGSAVSTVKRGRLLRLGWPTRRGASTRERALEMAGFFPYFRMVSVPRITVPVPMQLAGLSLPFLRAVPSRPLLYKANAPNTSSCGTIIGSCSSCKSCSSCASCSSCSSGCSCQSCSSCQTCGGNCQAQFSCGGCGSCCSCGGCVSCVACGGCGSCASCNSCVALLPTQ
jgi:hypothetical protein